jgi:hypothetical protein
MHPRIRDVWRPGGTSGPDGAPAGERPLLQGHLKRRRGRGPVAEAAAPAPPKAEPPKAKAAPTANAAPKAGTGPKAKATPKTPVPKT